MLKKTNHLLLLFIFATCINSGQQKIKVPEWYSNPPKMEGKVYATGMSGNGRLLSLATALIELSKLSELSNIGDINIQSMTKDFSQEQEGGNHEYFEQVKKVIYSKQNSSILIAEVYQQTDLGNNIQYEGNISITYNNADYSDVVKELESLGIEIKIYFDDKFYYTLLEVPESALNKK